MPNCDTIAAPDDWPTNVTRLGSPPNLWMCFWTNSRAAMTSIKPALPGISRVSVERNPSASKRNCGMTRTMLRSSKYLGEKSLELPSEKLPPCTYTITGCFAASFTWALNEDHTSNDCDGYDCRSSAKRTKNALNLFGVNVKVQAIFDVPLLAIVFGHFGESFVCWTAGAIVLCISNTLPRSNWHRCLFPSVLFHWVWFGASRLKRVLIYLETSISTGRFSVFDTQKSINRCSCPFCLLYRTLEHAQIGQIDNRISLQRKIISAIYYISTTMVQRMTRMMWCIVQYASTQTQFDDDDENEKCTGKTVHEHFWFECTEREPKFKWFFHSSDLDWNDWHEIEMKLIQKPEFRTTTLSQNIK